MGLNSTIKNIIQEILKNTEGESLNRTWTIVYSEPSTDYRRPPPPPPGPPRSTDFYLGLGIAVIILAMLFVIGILVCFCRRSEDRRSSQERIITNIKLQDSTHGWDLSQQSHSPQKNFSVARGEDIKITIVEKY